MALTKSEVRERLEALVPRQNAVIEYWERRGCRGTVDWHLKFGEDNFRYGPHTLEYTEAHLVSVEIGIKVGERDAEIGKYLNDAKELVAKALEASERYGYGLHHEDMLRRFTELEW